MPNLSWTLRAVAIIVICGFTTVASALPTIHQISEAAQSGDLNHAQKMIDEVLTARPNSAKAHYVAAEVAAKAGQLERGREELAKAEQFAPGLPFAKPAAVAELNSLLGRTSSSSEPKLPMMFKRAGNNFGIGTLLIGGALLLLIINWLRRRSVGAVSPPLGSNGGLAPANSGPYANSAPSGGGFGSSLASGIGTGLGIGAGLAAGEALAHGLMGGDRNRSSSAGLVDDETNRSYTPGDASPDFGIEPDAQASWDNDAGGSSDDFADSSW
ncbi:MAG: hypothetical protein HYX63_04780 [Gammaproteobacteria bacterium]|nr:hypothetical protein [Gammaproteobacteria bacterium]